MKNLNKLKRFAQKDNLSLPEIMWINYAESIGLDISYIDNVFLYKKDSHYYKILGLYWKYANIEIIDNSFNNELYIGLEKDYTNEYTILNDKIDSLNNKINSLNISSNASNASNTSNNLNLQNTIPTINTSLNNIFSIFNNTCIINSTSEYESISTCISNENEKIKNRLDIIEKGFIENKLIKYPAEGEVFLPIHKFCEDFMLNNEKIPNNIKKIKFEIKIYN